MIGVGSVMALCGLIVLLTDLTRHRRAKPTLIVWGREWRLCPGAILSVLAGVVCLGFPFVYVPAVPPHQPAVVADRPGGHDPDRHVSTDDDEARPILHDPGGIVTGTSVAADPPLPRAPAAPQDSPAPDSVNLTGTWTITNTVVETSYPPYRDLRLGFRLVIRQEGPLFTGAGEKYLENGRTIPAAARRPIRIQGRVMEGSVVEATFEEAGHARLTEGRFRLTPQDRQHLRGTFVSTAANARGASYWRRTSADPGVPPREQASQAGRVSPPPEPSASPVIAMHAPAPGQQVSTAQLQVRGTATGAPGLVRLEVHVNGVRQFQRLTSGETTVDFSEPVALHHGPNAIVVTAVDRHQHSARQRVTVTRLDEPSPSLPNAEGPAATPGTRVGRPSEGSAAEHRSPRLALGMSQSEVRALLGAPAGVEEGAGFVFWQYGTDEHEQEVVFEQNTGRVLGWVGFPL
jgi:hypothetical protein